MLRSAVHGVRSEISWLPIKNSAIEAFNFSIPTKWPNWIRHIKRFRNTFGIVEKSEESQIDTLIYSMGDKADDILQSFNLSEDALKSYRTVKEKFDTHFVQRKNNISSIFYIVRKNWLYPPTPSGSYRKVAGGRLADEIRVDFKILKFFYRLNYSDFFV